MTGKGVARARRTLTALVVFALVFVFAASLSVAGGGLTGGATSQIAAASSGDKNTAASSPLVATSYQDIASAGPLTHVYVGSDASCQVAHTGDSALELYPPSTIPGDCGSFVVVGGTLYAPDFSNHGGTATGGLGSYTPFTPISQTAVTGAGTSGNPYKVVTTVGVGATGLQLVQTVTYVVGRENYQTDAQLVNTTGSAINAIIYAAGDCYLGGSDVGYGWVSSGAVACTKTQNNSPADRIEQWFPLTAGSKYYQTGYSQVWSWIGSKTAFPNTCACTSQIDNGAGLSWNATVPANGSSTYSYLTTFSPTGVGAGTPVPTSRPAARDEGRPAHVVFQNAIDNNISNPAGGLYTATLVVKNKGQGSAGNVRASYPLTSSVQVLNASFTSPLGWVRNVVTDTNIDLDFGPLIANGVTTATLTLQVAPSAAMGDAIAARMAGTWGDDTGGGSGASNLTSFRVDTSAASDGNQDRLFYAQMTPASSGSTTLSMPTQFFAPNESVGGWLNKPDGTTQGGYRWRADADGNLTVTFDTSGLANGNYSFVATGMDTEINWVGLFTVGAAPAATATATASPEATMTPTPEEVATPTP